MPPALPKISSRACGIGTKFRSVLPSLGISDLIDHKLEQAGVRQMNSDERKALRPGDDAHAAGSLPGVWRWRRRFAVGRQIHAATTLPLRRVIISAFLGVAIVFSLSGCVSARLANKAVGQAASMRFRVLDSAMPRVLVFWREEPVFTETMLALEPSLPGCREIKVFANPTAKSSKPLSAIPTPVEAIHLDKGIQEAAMWRHIPAVDCAILLTVGTIAEDGFVGVSATTRQGALRRIEMPLPGDRPAQPGLLLALPFVLAIGEPLALGFSAALVAIAAAVSPFLGIAYLLEAAEEPSRKSITVSFDFPDGSRREAVIGHAEATRILEKYFPDGLESETIGAESADTREFVRFWTRAALMKLTLEFREEGSGEPDASDFRLTYVGGHWGKWMFDPRDGRGAMANLTTLLKNAPYLRFRLEPTS